MNLGAKPGLLIRDVLIPASLPVIFPGLRIALGVGWMCVVAAELIAAQSGLGFGKPWSLKTLSHTANENPGAFHPGALKAYKELGAVK